MEREMLSLFKSFFAMSILDYEQTGSVQLTQPHMKTKRRQTDTET